MARPTYAEAIANGDVRQLLAMLVSQQEPDGTAISDSAAAGLPTSLGQKTMANSTSVVLASDQAGGSPNGGLKAELVGALAGEDFTNDRMMTGSKPADADSVLETLQSAAVATGNGTAINMKGYRSLSVYASLAGTATITFEATLDDSTWFTVGLLKSADGTYESAPTTTGSWFTAQGRAWSQFRARISAWSSGAVTVKSRKQP